MIGPFGLKPRGTMSVRALPMAKALAARGHRVTMLLPPWQNPEDAGKSWEEDGVAVENIDLPPRVPMLFHLLTALRLTRRALALRPDVVHLCKPKAYSGLAHWLLKTCEVLGEPKVRITSQVYPHLVVDTDDWEGPGGWNEIGGYTRARRRFFAWQERWGLTHADAVTVASRALESLVWAMGVPPERVFYVPNGVCCPKPDIKNERLETGDWPTILLYTRFFEFPVSRVIEVLHRVRKQIPEARLFVVGKGLFGEERELFRLAGQQALTVADNSSQITNHVLHFTHDITYCGWVPTETLPDYFARADVAIYPFDDTLVNRCKCAVKLLDLLAAGVPVVAEAVGQNRETIRHGETGWLVEPGDVEAFAEAVVQLLENTPLRKRLGQAAADDVQERFGWDRLVKKVERAYRDE
ncbi:MAG: glycosyltransferase family 4 protein [Anaerolineae bacterium]|nr:glycosyltransferase family 4 protein [Anaerolineae bacterium]